MKFLFDYFPIVCFFVIYKFYGIFAATGAAMGASLLQVGIYWLQHRRFEKLHLITMILIFVLGGSTLIFHKSIFIKWKPTIVYWVFSIVLLGSQYIGSKPILNRMLKNKINLPIKIWYRLNLSWGLFFLALGALNLYVVYHYDTNTWVNFKLFGTLGLTLLFIIIQAIYMARNIQEDEIKENQ